MNKLNITRENGGIPATMQGEDHISGLIVYMAILPRAFQVEHIHGISTIETAEKLGITADSDNWEVKLLHYHLSEVFRINPAIILYVGLFTKPSGAYTFNEIKFLQNYAKGSIRQVGIYLGDVALSNDLLTKAQGVANTLDLEGAPLSVLLAPKLTSLTGAPTNLRTSNSRVSILIAESLDETAKALRKAGRGKQVTAIGLFLALVSKARVHQSISYVAGFPTGLTEVGFVDGTPVRGVDKSLLDTLDKAGYIFLRYYPSINGAFASDSHTMDNGGNVYVEQESGKLQPYSVAHLEIAGNRILEEMNSAGELSGYKVFINPNQNVSASSTLEIVIKNVPVGVIRRFNVSIGYVPKL